MADQPKDDQLNNLLEDALNDLLIEDDVPPVNEPKESPKIEETLKKVVEVTGVKNGDDGNISTGGGGSSNSGNIGVDEEEMNKFFANMTEQLKNEMPNFDPEEAKTKINESVPQIFDLMQSLLSKELLYPALKDLSPKFEEWLKKNAANLSKSERSRYKKQKDIINEIIEVFDDETLDRQESFEKNLDLMEKMQSLGSPPEELTVSEKMGACSIM